MADAPATSITLLKGLASGADSVRWTEFYRAYEASMRSFLQSRFPNVDADDVIQETMLALTRCMPDYHYTPDDGGHFRSYLMGILKHKANDAIRRALRESERIARFSRRTQDDAPTQSDVDEKWRHAAMNAALEQILSDESINTRTREIFRHVAVLHEPPGDVAAAFGVTRNNVDQIKMRLVERLAKLVAAMTSGD